jgi:hypothetical protein
LVKIRSGVYLSPDYAKVPLGCPLREAFNRGADRRSDRYPAGRSCLVGAAEGLSCRAIRRALASRESARLYHRAKYGQVVVLTLGGAVVLAWPAPVAWALRVGVGSVVVGVLAAGQWAHYKKHV